jgi:hypothetical protein
MSFLLAACVLLVALFAGAFLDGIAGSDTDRPRRPDPSMDLW